ncbi:MAG: retropepsin-like domain-containing protein [Gemmatimonadota bacterium]|nr:MAG: retropepsin-like domain-containing protein [Gemmatimonadota bacterium]
MKRASALAEHLESNGYVRVLLERTSIGQLLVQARVNGQPMTMILDTGASHTLLHREAAKRIGVEGRASSCEATGAGGSTETLTASLEEFGLNEIPLGPKTVPVIDLGSVNAKLESAGVSPVDGVVGVDVLGEANAVVEFEHATLFLKLAGAEG